MKQINRVLKVVPALLTDCYNPAFAIVMPGVQHRHVCKTLPINFLSFLEVLKGLVAVFYKSRGHIKLVPKFQVAQDGVALFDPTARVPKLTIGASSCRGIVS